MSDRTLSGRRALLLGALTLVVVGTGLFGWGAFASLSGAVVASGQVEAESGDWIVEHVHGGAVAAVLVADGDRVPAGAPLVRLDGEALRSEAAVLEAELFDLVAQRNLLEAEFQDRDAITWDAPLAGALATDARARAVADGHRRLFEARRATRRGVRAHLRERIAQTRRQVVALETQANAAAQHRRLIAEELAGQRTLLERGATRRPRVLALERNLALADGRSGEIAARTATARGEIAALEIELLQIDNRRVEEAESQLRQTHAREASVRERLDALRRRIGRLEVRAPITGIVHDLAVSTPGEVLAPGEAIAMVVPDDTVFTVKVRIEPVHIDQVRAGQDAVLRFSAFSMRTTPEYGATVLRVSADALTDGSGQPWYEAELAIGEPVRPDPDSGPGAWFSALTGQKKARAPASLEDTLALAPGMPVEAYLRTGERSPLSYLVKPLADYFERALREE